MALAYGDELIAGAFAYGPGGFGLLAELVASDGLRGPGYPYAGLSFPADNGKEIAAYITQPPTLGTLTVYDDFSFDYVGATDFFLYELQVDGVVPSTDIGYGPGIGRVELVVGGVDGGTLSGSLTLDTALAAGVLGGTNVSQLSGNVDLSAAVAAGGLIGGGFSDLSAAGQRHVVYMPALTRRIRVMDRTPTLLDDFDVEETHVITFPCAKSIEVSETITDAVITCEYFKGAADASAAARAATPRQILGTDVLQLVTGVQADTWYHMRGVITTSTGRVLVGACIFKGVRL